MDCMNSVLCVVTMSNTGYTVQSKKMLCTTLFLFLLSFVCVCSFACLFPFVLFCFTCL